MRDGAAPGDAQCRVAFDVGQETRPGSPDRQPHPADIRPIGRGHDNRQLDRECPFQLQRQFLVFDIRIMEMHLNDALVHGFLEITRDLEARNVQLLRNLLHRHILAIKEVATAQQLRVLRQAQERIPVDFLGR